MTEDLDSISEEERSLFRPFTRESLLVIEERIANEQAKQRELEKKRAEGEVSWAGFFPFFFVPQIFFPSRFFPLPVFIHPPSLSILTDPKEMCFCFVFVPPPPLVIFLLSYSLYLSLVYIYR